MFKKNDFVVYKKDACKIKDVKKNGFQGNDYFVLSPIDDDSLTIEVPITSLAVRSLISKKEVTSIIKDIPSIEVIDETNDKIIEQEYRRLLSSGEHRDLIKIIKTTYLRNKNRELNNKKIGEKDDNYFKKAEKILYNEFSLVLNKSFSETKKYVADQVIKNSK